MRLIDERGRFFGKLNVIDALVISFVIVLIPIAYGAYALFRTPTATIVSIEPATVTRAVGATLTVRGENLRPYLRARVGTLFVPFLIETPSNGEVRLTDLPPGTYDFALFDEAQQVAIKPGALTILAPSAPIAPTALQLDVQAVGAFVGLATGDARLITTGPIPPIGEILAVRPPQLGILRVKIGANAFATTSLPGEARVPAIIRLSCAVVNGECKVENIAVAQNVMITVPLAVPPSKERTAPSAPRQVGFLIDQVFPAGTRAAFPAIATLHVRFAAEPEILDVMKPGDVDLADAGAETGRAVLMEVGADRRPMRAVTSTDGILHRSVQLDQPMLGFTGTVRLPVVFTPSGWSYKDRLVKVGAAFTFETMSGAMIGVIVDMNLGQEK